MGTVGSPEIATMFFHPKNPKDSPIGFSGPLFAQMRHQWAINLLLGLSLACVVALYAYTRNSSEFQHRSIQLIMKEMGHNLWFIDAMANPLHAATGSPDLPVFTASDIHRLVEDRAIASTYWGKVLQVPWTIEGREVLLSGLRVLDDHQVTEEKAHLLEPLEAGSAALGHALARAWGLVEGDTLAFEGIIYQIRKVYPPRSTLDDERLWIPLEDAQELLEQPGKANLILGFLCMRGMSLETGLLRLEERLAGNHPSFQVLPMMHILQARALARMTTSHFLNYLLIAVASLTVLLMAVVGWMEIHDRRHELAILLAMGAGPIFLISFILAKLVLVGLAAALIGFIAGSWASIHWLSDKLITHTDPVSVLWLQLPGTVGMTLLLVGVASIGPLIHLIRLDPRRILSEE